MVIETVGKELAVTITDFLTGELEGFRSARISSFPVRAGIRESRRVKGHYELTKEDILTGARFEDEVAFSSWPIELRETTRGPRFRFPEGNRSCGIPLGAIRSTDVTNLLMAGRCISSTHEAQAAIRVMGTCMATGEAAGRSAASKIFAKSGLSFSDAMTKTEVVNS